MRDRERLMNNETDGEEEREIKHSYENGHSSLCSHIEILVVFSVPGSYLNSVNKSTCV